ncbi:L10-interacting MYB domain-containing protein-like [Vitis riparia]|uniref:L10-interacting MYB domain-containing protein-like n=1 Tax=Vitis riparia TaxID=96939 RepID=UPI00155A7A87|nr:L10-interacting MYB domain-containing protein-like [Vitis riparia]
MATQLPSSQDNNNQAAKWDATRDAYLVEQLLYHQSIGRRPQSVWSKEAWRETRAAFNLKFSTSYNVKVFKNRLTKLKDQHNTIRELIGVNGFGWDDHYHMVTAENTVWDEYILKYPKAKHFRGKTFPLYNRLCIMFEGMSSEGRDAQSIGRPKVIDETENAQSQRCVADVAYMDNDTVPSSDDETSSEQPIQNRTRMSPVSSTRRVRRRCESVGEKLISLLTDLLAGHAGKFHASQPLQTSATSGEYSYSECLQELKRIEGLAMSEIVKGAHVLKDEQNRIAFMTFEGPARVAFLQSCFK